MMTPKQIDKVWVHVSDAYDALTMDNEPNYDKAKRELLRALFVLDEAVTEEGA